jgi:hypothetical protein
MANEAPRPPSVVVQSIEENAASVRKAAAEITARIDKFAQYLSRIPGRTETVCLGDHPDDDDPECPVKLALKFHRDGSQWVLSWGHYSEPNSMPDIPPVHYSPLDEAPMQIKIYAVRMFPEFLEAIVKSQVRIVKKLNKANESFDAFFALLPEQGKKGGK